MCASRQADGPLGTATPHREASMATIQERLAEKLVSVGCEPTPRANSKKYRAYRRPDGGFFYLGKSGALRTGPCVSKSESMEEVRDQLLAADAPEQIARLLRIRPIQDAPTGDDEARTAARRYWESRANQCNPNDECWAAEDHNADRSTMVHTTHDANWRMGDEIDEASQPDPAEAGEGADQVEAYEPGQDAAESGADHAEEIDPPSDPDATDPDPAVTADPPEEAEPEDPLKVLRHLWEAVKDDYLEHIQGVALDRGYDQATAIKAAEALDQLVETAEQPRRRQSRSEGTPRAPRADSKQHQVIEMLRQPAGATIAEISHAMNWQEHTTRALVTATIGRKLGHEIAREKIDGKSRYRIVD